MDALEAVVLEVRTAIFEVLRGVEGGESTFQLRLLQMADQESSLRPFTTDVAFTGPPEGQLNRKREDTTSPPFLSEKSLPGTPPAVPGAGEVVLTGFQTFSRILFQVSALPWTLLTNHGHVLVCLALDSEMRMRDVAARVGITERAVQLIVRDLTDAGFVLAERRGRRNHYTLSDSVHFRHPLEEHVRVEDFLELVRR